MANHMNPKWLSRDETQVRISKYGPFLEQEHISRVINLPAGYGKDRIVAMVRDPWWLFVYWEITAQTEKDKREEIIRRAQAPEKSILRIYDITGKESIDKTANRYFDITLKDMARNWYIDVGAPNRRWCVEIGLLSKEGDFYSLARSNIVNTPRFGISDVLDEAWMTSEEQFWWLFGVSGGFDVGKSSLEMKELLKKRIEEWIFSGGFLGLASQFLQKNK